MLVFSLLLLSSTNTLCQTITFDYDLNGNRISRKIFVEQLQQSVENFQDIELTSLKISKSSKTADSEERKGSEQHIFEKDSSAISEENQLAAEGKIKIHIYPNPVKGMLKIDISNMPLGRNNKMVLFDISGTKLIEKTNFEDY